MPELASAHSQRLDLYMSVWTSIEQLPEIAVGKQISGT